MATGRRGPPHRLDGVILHLGHFGEAHLLVDVLCAEAGRQTVVARHARASKRRFAGVLVAFADVALQVQGGRHDSMATVTQAELTGSRDAIRQSLNRINRATTLVACVRQLCPEHEAAPEMLALLRLALDYVAQGDVVRAAGAYPRLAQAAGIARDVAVCERCRTRRDDTGVVGTRLLCPSCNTHRAFAPAGVTQALMGGRIYEARIANAVEDIVVAWCTEHSGKAIVRLPQVVDETG